MDLTEFKKGAHLSASALNEYMDCSFSYRLGRIDKITPEFQPEALLFGTTIHRVLGEFYQARMTGERLLLKELHGLFDKYWHEAAEGRDDIKYAEGKNFEILLNEGKELLTVYHEKLPDDQYRVLAIEEGIFLFVDGLDIPIIGYIDLLEEDEAGTLIITDWKTSGRAYSFDEVEKNLQVTLYEMALKQQGYEDREILLKFDCLIKTKKPKFEQYYTSRTVTDERRVATKIRHVWEGISRGVFIPNDTSWKCSGCVYAQYCKDYMEGRHAQSA